MNDAEKDYFFVNRKLLNSNRWLCEKFTRAQAWIDLFGLAQHTPNFFMVRGIKVELNRGQLGYSQLTLAERWKWSRDKVRRYLKRLESDGDIIQQNNEVTTIITIVKYDLWQGHKFVNNTTNNTSEKHQKNIKQDTYNKDNKDNKENIYSSFELFWSEYPKRTSKKKTQELWVKLSPSEELVEKIITSLRKQKESSQWQNLQYVPYPTTWLNQERWNDEIIKQQSQSSEEPIVPSYAKGFVKNNGI